MKNKTKYSSLITTILLVSALAGPANAETPSTAPLEIVPTETSQIATVKAEPTSQISFEKPTVVTTPAPVVVETVVALVTSQTSKAATPTPAAVPVAPRPQPAPVTAQAPAPVAAPAVAGSGRGAALLASAYSQIGQTQDCTAMVERALASIGIISGDLAPAQFHRFGPVVSNPQPGDIMISSGHVGIYAGNGMMVSGGFNGNQTVSHPVSYVGGASYVRI